MCSFQGPGIVPACSLAGFTKRKTAIVIISDTCVFPAVTSKKKKKGLNQLISQTNCVKHQVPAPPSSCCNKSFFYPQGAFQPVGHKTVSPAAAATKQTTHVCDCVCVCILSPQVHHFLKFITRKHFLPQPILPCAQ